MLKHSFYLVAISLILKANALPPQREDPSVVVNNKPAPSEVYTNSIVVDEDEPWLYEIHWKLVDKDEYIQFELICESTGWVGFGLSPNGDMPGADIAIGWVDKSGKAYLRDAHAVSRSPPLVDDSQDLTLIKGEERDGYTIIKFKRPLKSCDTENDIEIKKETNFLIFAWNNEDPDPTLNNWAYHQGNRRIVVDILLNFKDKNVNIDELIVESEQAEKIEFTLKNHLIKPKQTYYFCEVFTLPPSDIDRHIIRFQVLVTPGNKDVLHHLIVHECDDFIDFSAPFNQGTECGYSTPSVPIQYCLGSPMVAVWGVGGTKDYFFPNETGFPVSKSNKPKHYVVEYHFDNPKLVANRFDSSGIRLYITSNLREYDIGMIEAGTGVDLWDLQIPPEVESIQFTGVCYAECTDKFFPPEGVTVFSAVLHTHLAGRSVKTKLVRKNEIIMNLFDNPKYDFNYQFNIEIEPIKLYKGDTLISECQFNSMDRTNMTFWGYSTYDEMCLSLIYYYPRNPRLYLCFSKPSKQSAENFYTSLVKDGLLPSYVTSSQQDQHLYMYEIHQQLLKVTEFSDALKKRYIDFFKNPGEQVAICGAMAYPEDIIYDLEKPFPNPKDAIKEEIRECREPNDQTTTKQPNNQTSRAFFSFIFVVLQVFLVAMFKDLF